MKPVIAVLVAVVFLSIGAMGVSADEKGPVKVQLRPKTMGVVDFPHQLHQDRTADCGVCHHKGVEAGACTECHDIDASPPKGKDAFHKVCKDCHSAQGGPVKCAGCHTR